MKLLKYKILQEFASKKYFAFFFLVIGILFLANCKAKPWENDFRNLFNRLNTELEEVQSLLADDAPIPSVYKGAKKLEKTIDFLNAEVHRIGKEYQNIRSEKNEIEKLLKKEFQRFQKNVTGTIPLVEKWHLRLKSNKDMDELFRSIKKKVQLTNIESRQM